MKKIIFIVAILISNISLGAGVQPLKQEITEKLIIDLSMVELDENQQDFVLVSFYICNDEIEIADISGTQKQLIEKVKSKLSKLKIEQTYDEGTVYQYKFTFEKK
ncbi:MAG: hypothetical protein ACJA1C_000355 [Crocinitomicaceae bacterium]|jgi:hypothetical protein